MATRLVALGYPVTAYDIAPERMDAVRKAGARVVGSVAEAAHAADFVVLNLPTTEAVERVTLGEAGLCSALEARQLVIDFSTIRPAAARELAARLRAARGAGDGTLTVMAGGVREDFERAAPLLRDVAARVTYLGAAGSGLAAKMINQLIVGIGHAMLAEAIVLAESSGIDAAGVPGALAGGLADSNLLQRFYPRMARRDFAPQGYVRQLLKDLEMVHEFAAATKSPLPMTAQALSLYRMLAHLGHTELDTTALIKLYDRT
jgi:3-hydroxyisobutyrate dehydrogenase